ncbi:MAG: hypothetical protein QOH10_2392 [Actinomycetota bacterium]|jgi:hypothetical protein|nr:hypothetical protein [Actinomycetota bacterium]
MIRSLRIALVIGLAAAAGIGGAVVAVGPAGATVNGHCGDVVVGSLHTGQNLRQGGLEAPDLHTYTERVNHALAPSVAVDFRSVGLYNQPSDLPNPRPILTSGTVVNSYLVHSDPVGHPPTELRTVTLGFTSDILGVQIFGATLTAANAHQLRFPGVTYPNVTSGIELSTGGNGDFARLINQRTIAISFKTSNAIDDVRIITRGSTSSASALAGYRILAADGGVFDFGGQQFYGSTGGRILNQPIVSGVNTCGNAGYWFVARDGGVFAYGDADFHGSLGATPPATPVAALAATPTAAGYYLATQGGAVYPFGDAQFFSNNQNHHDATYLHLKSPLVGMASTPTGHGYWLLGGDGGIFSFGDAAFWGSTGALKLVSPVIGFSPTRTGRGYWLFAADGGIFSFGDARFFGSVGGALRTHPIVGMRVSASGNGYWLTDSAGKVFAFGDAAFAGDMSNVHLFRPMIGMM